MSSQLMIISSIISFKSFLHDFLRIYTLERLHLEQIYFIDKRKTSTYIRLTAGRLRSQFFNHSIFHHTLSY